MSVTSPITACASSHFAQIASTRSRRSATHDGDHPLLALGDHDLPGLHLVLAERNPVEVDVDARRRPAPSRRGRTRARLRRNPAATPRARARRARGSTSISFLPVNGSPICTVGRLSASSSPSSALARTLAPPIPSRPVVAPYRTSSPPVSVALRTGQPLDRQQPDAHGVHEAVPGVRLVEDGFAADRRHADAVSVVADPLDRALEHPARARRSGARPAARSAGRPSRSRRAGSRRRRSPRPGTARPRTGGCGSRP